MSILKFLLCVLVLASPWLSEASKPSCTGVGDFEACLGNTDEFCPRNISCQCKNQEPFCRCDFFRIGWKEYWYTGPKCNHLWNTLDFILVATLPGGILLIIVVVLFSVVYCMKTGKVGKQPKPPSSGAQQNPAFSADPAAGLGHGPRQAPGVRDVRGGHSRAPGWAKPAGLGDPAQRNDAWVGQIPKVVPKRQDFNDASIPNQRQNYSPVYAQPLRTADPASNYFPHSQAHRAEYDYPRKDLPYPVYPEARQCWRYQEQVLPVSEMAWKAA